VKISRPVLRGGKGSNAFSLPDTINPIMMWRSDKKLDHQRQSMARKEKQQSLKPSSKLRNTDIKISEAILHLCEPLRKQYKDNNRIKVIISITVMAWNISLFP
jgi:hypothetical protein